MDKIVAPADPNDGNGGTSSVESLMKYSYGEEALDVLSDPKVQMRIATKRAAWDLRFASRSVVLHYILSQLSSQAAWRSRAGVGVLVCIHP